MQIDLIDLDPKKTRNHLWISDLFDCNIRTFNGTLFKNSFPIFIVHGSRNVSIKYRSINSDLFEYLNSNGHSFGLVHIMDENYDHDISVYNMDKCVIVFREYYRPRGGILPLVSNYCKSFFLPVYNASTRSGFCRFAADLKIRVLGTFSVLAFMRRQYLPQLPSTKKILFFPLGYTDRVQREKIDVLDVAKGGICFSKITERKYRFSFCGQGSKKDRKTMLECFKYCCPNYIFESDSASESGALSGEVYGGILAQSIFVPCPLGNINIDTYRLFEALDAGAIPILTSRYAYQPYDYYKVLLGDHPIPTFRSWRQAEIFVRNISDDSIEKLSEEINFWYKSYRLFLKSIINKSLSTIIVGNLLTSDLHPIAY